MKRFALLPSGQSGEHQQGSERINVAFVISPEANVMDLAGVWEVFQDTTAGKTDERRSPFRLYTVSDHAEPIEAAGGLSIIPDYSLAEAPAPQVISVGAQRGSAQIHRWLEESAGHVKVLMSVCTGAFHLGRAGLLEGRRATTHHEHWESFRDQFPDVILVPGRRFVDEGNIVTAGGLTSGIDAALHVVGRLLDEFVAERTALYMEHQGDGWRTGEMSLAD